MMAKPLDPLTVVLGSRTVAFYNYGQFAIAPVPSQAQAVQFYCKQQTLKGKV